MNILNYISMRKLKLGDLKMKIFLLLFILITNTLYSQKTEKSYSLIIRNVNIIPIYKDTIIQNSDVFVINNKIVKIEKHNKKIKTKSMADKIIYGQDRFLIPGLIDCHVHYAENEKLFASYDSLYFKYGITKVLALNGTDNLLTHRKNIRSKKINGPDIYCSSPGNNDSLMTASQANDLMKEYQSKGYDFIKIYSDLSKEGFEEFSKSARGNGLRILGHIPQRVTTNGILHSNMELVAHAEEFLYNPPINYMMGEITEPNKPNELFLYQVADSVAVYKKVVSPTLIAFYSILQSSKNITKHTKSVPLPLSHPIAKYWEWEPTVSFIPKKFYSTVVINRLQYAYDYQVKLVRALYEKGVTILAGTDAPTMPGLVPGYSLHKEMQLLSKAGLPNYEVLKSATLNPAIFLNVSSDCGTIEVGKEASFLLLKKNPLISITNTLTIDKVIVKGIVHQ